MNDLELAEEIKTWLNAGKFYSQLALSRPQWQQIIAALRRGPALTIFIPGECSAEYTNAVALSRTPLSGPDFNAEDNLHADTVAERHDALRRPPSGEMVMVLRSFVENRCHACGWPLAGSATKGCVPFNCSYRPSEHSDEHAGWLKRAYEMESVRAMLSAAEASKEAK